MSQCEETEEGVHPSETPLCGQHGSQTEAQRVPRESNGSPSSSVSIKSDRSKADIIDFKEGRSSLKSDFVLSSSEDEEGLRRISSSEDEEGLRRISSSEDEEGLRRISSSEDEEGLRRISSSEDEEGLRRISSSEDEEDVAADDGDLPEQRRPDSPVLRMPVESSWSTRSSSASQSIDSYPKVALKRKASTGSSSLSVDSSQGCIDAKEKLSSPKKRLENPARTLLCRRFRGRYSEM